MKSFILALIIILSLPLTARATDDQQNNYFCVLKLIKIPSREMIQTAYGMGNVGAGINLNELCTDFYSRDIATEGNDLYLIEAWGDIAPNPDQFWLTNNWRRPLTESEIEDYKCLFKQENFAIVLSNGAVDLMPETPDSFRLPALILNSLEEYNSPIMKFLFVQAYQTVLPILSIASVVKLWKLSRR